MLLVGAPGAQAAAANTGLATNAAYLCSRADNNGLTGSQLADSAASVKAACTLLKRRTARALTTYTVVARKLRTQGNAAVALGKSTCAVALAADDDEACIAALDAAIVTLQRLRARAKVAAAAYAKTVTAARAAFWKTIHSLDGGEALLADSTAPMAPPAGIPENTAVSAT